MVSKRLENAKINAEINKIKAETREAKRKSSIWITWFVPALTPMILISTAFITYKSGIFDANDQFLKAQKKELENNTWALKQDSLHLINV